VTPKRRCRLSVAVPASVVSEHGGLREKTEVIGRLARSAAIFRAEEVLVYPDAPDEAHLIRLLLSYAECPQYLRKYLFRVRPELQYAGILPPLRTPHHPLGNSTEKLRVGEYREGVLLPDGSARVDVGVDQNLTMTGKVPSPGSRLTVKVTQIRPHLKGVAAKLSEVPEYWGFQVQATKKTLGEIAGFYDLAVGTSRTGKPISAELDRLRSGVEGARSMLVAFGSPREGLQEILKREGRTPEEVFAFNLNTVPGQGTATVRTDEAVAATLAILNLLDAPPA